jgi:hypothetical protein
MASAHEVISELAARFAEEGTRKILFLMMKAAEESRTG